MATGPYERGRFRDPYEAEAYVRRLEEDNRRREEQMMRELMSLRAFPPMLVKEAEVQPLAAPKAPAPTRSKLLLLL